MADQLRFGLYGLLRGGDVDPDTLARRGRLAEEAGFESLWVGDHIALPGSAGHQPRLEVVVGLSYLAGVTSTIRLAFGVIVLPARQPVLLAKQLSSIDILAKGRLIAGFGVGYVEQELAAMGVPLAERGARTDEYIAAMRALWTDPEPSFNGRFVAFDGLYQCPPPVQRPHPPIVIGGHSTAAYRRAVTNANGWYGVYLNIEQTAQALSELREVAAGCPRPAQLGDLEITVTPPPGSMDLPTARGYAELGVHRLVLQPAAPDASDMEELIEATARTLIGQA